MHVGRVSCELGSAVSVCVFITLDRKLLIRSEASFFEIGGNGIDIKYVQY